MSHALAHCSRRIRAREESERERSISLGEYFSENTVKPRRRRERGDRRREFLALGIIASGSERVWQKRSEWKRRSGTDTHWNWVSIMRPSDFVEWNPQWENLVSIVARLVNKPVVYIRRTKAWRASLVEEIRASFIMGFLSYLRTSTVDKIFHHYISSGKLSTEIFNTVIEINYSILSK